MTDSKMIAFIIICIIFTICGIFVLSFYSKRVSHILAEIKYEMIYNVMGITYLIEDIILKNKNKIDNLPERKGDVAVVTGGSRGIGVEVVRMLAECGMNVIIGCRNVNVGRELAKKIQNENNNSPEIKCFELDVGSLSSVRSFAKVVGSQYPKINLLVNNAGIMFGPFDVTVDGYESQFAVNYLGHFLLTHLLMPNIIAAGESSSINARIVNVSSCAHLRGFINFTDVNMRNNYISAAAYAQSKLAQVLFSNYLNKICQEQNIPVEVFSVHPGIVNTDLFNGTPIKTIAPWFPALFFKNARQGATPIVYASVSGQLENKGGSYISNCVLSQMSPIANNVVVQKKLFDLTMNMLNVKKFGTF